MPKRKFNMTRSSMASRPYRQAKRRYAPKYTPVVRQAVRAAKRSVANMRTGGYLGIEKKFLDCAWNSVAINSSTDGSGIEMQPSSGCTDCISVPAQGDGESQRDGRKYTITDVWVSGNIDTSPIPDQADASDIKGYYFALVLDTQANGATLVSENVFVNPSTLSDAMLPQPLRNLQNSKRFRILASKYIRPGGMYSITDGTATGSLSQQNSPVVSLGWKGKIVCDSTGTTAAVASASDNAIHLVACVGAAVGTPVFRGKSRVRFYG